jgi:hypothetical protein
MASRKDQKDALRAERIAREQQAASAERRKRLAGYAAGGLLAVAALVAIVVVLTSGDGGGGGGGGSAGGGQAAASGDFPSATIPPVEITDLDQAVEASGCELTEDPEERSDHVEGAVEYEGNPPTSGNHNPIPTEDGAYTEAPPPENLVHAHEHGRIILQYQPDAADTVKGGLKALYDEDPYHMIVTPSSTDMPFEVAATTWTRTLGCPEMNDQVYDAIRAFRDEYRDKGPEFVP